MRRQDISMGSKVRISIWKSCSCSSTCDQHTAKVIQREKHVFGIIAETEEQVTDCTGE